MASDRTKRRLPDFTTFDSSSEDGQDDMSSVLEAKASWLANSRQSQSSSETVTMSTSHANASKRRVSPNASEDLHDTSAKRSKLPPSHTPPPATTTPGAAQIEPPLAPAQTSTTASITRLMPISRPHSNSHMNEPHNDISLQPAGPEQSTSLHPISSRHASPTPRTRSLDATSNNPTILKEPDESSSSAASVLQSNAISVPPPSTTPPQAVSKHVSPTPPKIPIPDPFMDEDIPDPWLVHPGRYKLIMQRQADAKAAAEAKEKSDERDKLLSEALAIQTTRRRVPASKPVLPDAPQVSSPESKSRSQTNATDKKTSGKKRAASAVLVVRKTNANSKEATGEAEPTRSKSDGAVATVSLPAEAPIKRRRAGIPGANKPVKLEQLIGRQAAAKKSKKDKPTGWRGSKNPEKEGLALTKNMAYAEYLVWLDEEGPIRGGRRGDKFKDLTFLYLAEEGMNRKLSDTSRGRLDFLVKNGAKLAKEYNEETVTHVICETSDEAWVARSLGYKSIREVSLDTPIVEYTWATSCVNLDRDPWLNLRPQDRFIGRFIPVGHVRKVKPAPKRRGTSEDSDDSVRWKEELARSSPSPDFENAKYRHDSVGSVEEGNDLPGAKVEQDASCDQIMGMSSEDEEDAEKVKRLGEWVESARKVEEQDVNGTKPDAPPLTENEDDDGYDEPFAKGNPKNYLCCQVDAILEGPNPNQDVIDQLKELIKFYECKPDGHFQALQTRKAINALRRYPTRIKSESEAKALPNVGQKTVVKIMEIINTGKMKRLEYEKNSPEGRATMKFMGIYGVGPATAREWYQRGLRTLEDVLDGKDGVTLSPAQHLGLAYYNDIGERMTHEDAGAIFEQVRAIALQLDPKLLVEAMGSYRRGQPTCGDLDILITRPDDDGRNHAGLLHRLLPLLRKRGIIRHDLALPHEDDILEAKYMGLCASTTSNKLRRIDILTIPCHQWGSALLYFTGDDIFNRSMRLLARNMGYSLNQRGLFSGVVRDPRTHQKVANGTLVASRTEREIFDRLGVPWQEPAQRRRSV